MHFVFWVETDCVKVERWAPGGVCPLYFPTVLLPPLSLNTTLSCHTRCCSEPANASLFLSFYQTVPCALHHLTSLHPAASQNQGVSAQKFSSQLCSCAAVQLCSCAVVHPQLRWILTENTFNGTQMAGLREKSVGTGNQIELLFVFFFTTNHLNPWIRMNDIFVSVPTPDYLWSLILLLLDCFPSCSK